LCLSPTPTSLPAAIEAQHSGDDFDGDGFERGYRQLALEEYAGVSSDGGSFTCGELSAPRVVPTSIAPIPMELPRPTYTLAHKEQKPRIRKVSQKTIRTMARRPHLPPRREATLTEVGRTVLPVDGKPLDVAEYVFRNPPDPPAEVGQQPANVTLTPLPRALPLLPSKGKTSPGLGTRYKTHDMDLFAP